MPAAMLHGGGGVLLMMTTKFASQQTNKKHMHSKTNVTKAPSPSHPYQTQTTNTSKTTMATNTPLHKKQLTAEIQYFQMRKMDQR